MSCFQFLTLTLLSVSIIVYPVLGVSPKVGNGKESPIHSDVSSFHQGKELNTFNKITGKLDHFPPETDMNYQAILHEQGAGYDYVHHSSDMGSLIEELVDYVIDKQVPINVANTYDTFLKEAFSIHSVGHENTQENSNLMVKLVDKSGVEMDQNTLKLFVDSFKKEPSKLVRKLLEILFSREELSTLAATEKYGFKAIPENTLMVLEVFVNNVIETKMSHSVFVKIVSKFLNYSRRHQNVKNVEKVEKKQEIGQLPSNFPPDPKSMVELVAGSGVMIENSEFIACSTLYNNLPRLLIKRLLNQLIPQKNFFYMKVSKRYSVKSIPFHILDTVETFVRSKMNPEMSNSDFQKVVSRYLLNLRRENNKDKTKKSLETDADDRNVASSSMVELVDGSGVMIDKEKLIRLSTLYSNKPWILMKELFSEIIGVPELATMQATGPKESNTIPKNILDAVKESIGHITGTKFTHKKFMFTLKSQLTRLRKSQQVNNTYKGKKKKKINLL